jgi:hypothetical protein
MHQILSFHHKLGNKDNIEKKWRVEYFNQRGRIESKTLLLTIIISQVQMLNVGCLTEIAKQAKND